MEIASFLKLLSKNDGFGCGFFVFGCFSQMFNFVFLCCFLLVGLKFLHFKGPSHNSNEFVSKSYLVDGFNKKKPIILRDGIDLIKNRDSIAELLEKEIDEAYHHHGEEVESAEEEEDEESQSRSDDVDQVFDVITLRKKVKRERKRGDCMKTELEKERRAAEEAAEEAMAMILKLRMEKNAVEMEAKQYKRISEQKQVYDQQVIQSLQWMLMKLDHNIAEKIQD